MKKVAIAIFSILVLLVIAFIIAIPVSSDLTAKRTAQELIDTPLPEQTEYIESVNKAGKLAGNGNGMQYFGAILIKSNLSLEELQTYYAQYAMNDWEYVVEKQEDESIHEVEHANLSFHEKIQSKDYYIVYSWGSGNEILGEFDIRGN